MEPVVGTEASEEELKRALEWELSLDNCDLRSHAWYHGTIPRHRAEELMADDGDFLIRDCISQAGDFVLTCRWKGAPLHFVINKVVVQPYTVYEKIQYQFEDDCFDTVPDLVTFYVGNKRPITAASCAVASRPVNRSMPLTYYASRYGLQCQMQYATTGGEAIQVSSPQQQGSTVHELPQKTSNVTVAAAPRHQPHVAAPRPHYQSAPPRSLAAPPMQRVGSDPMLSPTLERRTWEIRPRSGIPSTDAAERLLEATEDKPPPKPSRVPSRRCQQRPAPVVKRVASQEQSPAPHVYSEPVFEDAAAPALLGNQVNNTSTQDSPVSPSTVVTASPNQPPHPLPPRKSVRKDSGETRFSFLDRKSASSLDDDGEAKVSITIPEMEPASCFDLTNFATFLLPPDNKPLEGSALVRVRSMVLDTGPRILANHLTRADLDILRNSADHDLGMGVMSGLELITLPQGDQLRLDLMERTECLKLFVAVTVVTCSNEEERVRMLNKWIQVAVDTKTALGNLYGFTGIMQGLAMTQISRLKVTWLSLRQKHTENALMFETKLRPNLRAMQECSNPLAPNTTIPYLLSLVTILHCHLKVMNDRYGNKESKPAENSVSRDGKEREAPLTVGLSWEQSAADYGLQLLLNHLEVARGIIQQCGTYKRNSEIVLDGVKYDDMLLDVFRTEFHLRFMWGSKGALVAAGDRYSKFEQVLSVMSGRCESNNC